MRKSALCVVFGVGMLAACSSSVTGSDQGAPVVDASADADATTEAKDAGAVDSATDGSTTDATTSPEETLYFGACVTALVQRDPAQALRFFTLVKRTPTSLEVDATPMLGWNLNPPPGQATTPPQVLQSYKRGTAAKASSAVAADGSFSLALGTLNLVAEANSLSGREAKIEGLTLAGRVGNDGNFCARFSGQLTVPYEYTFKADENTCLFIRLPEGTATPPLQSSAFVCP